MSNTGAPPIPNRPRSTLSAPSNLSYNSYGLTNNMNCSYIPNSSFTNPYFPTYNPATYNPSSMYPQNYSQNSFVRLAEASSRHAFQSVENVVSAFTSVSMMLDSTYQAIYSSFCAIIRVADSLSRLKSQLITIVSALSVCRILRRWYNYLRYRLGIRSETFANSWQEALNTTINVGPHADKTTWPLFLYLAVIIGAPWLLWRMLTKYFIKLGLKDWASGEGEHYTAQVLFDFASRNGDEISCTSGQIIKVAPRSQQPMIKDWLLASADGQSIGLVPATYVKILSHKPGSNIAAHSDVGTDYDGHARDGDVSPTVRV